METMFDFTEAPLNWCADNIADWPQPGRVVQGGRHTDSRTLRILGARPANAAADEDVDLSVIDLGPCRMIAITTVAAPARKHQ